MSTRARILLSGLGVAVLALLLTRFTTLIERRVEQESTPPGREARRNPLLGASRFLAARGIPAHPLDRLDALPPDGHVLLVGVPHLSLTAPFTGEVVTWIREGGHLIAAPCGGSGWGGTASTGGRLLEALDLEVDCLEDEPAADPEAAGLPTVIFEEPDEMLWVDLPWLQVTDHAAGDAGDATRAVAGSYVRGKGRLTLLGGTEIFTNRRIRDNDHARLLERLVTLDGRKEGAWLVHEMAYADLADLLWRSGWPAIAPAIVAVGLMLWRAAARFGPILPGQPAGSRSLTDHIEALGMLLWRRKPAALMAAVRQETLRVAAERRPHLMKLPPAERSAALAGLGGIPPAVAWSALEGPAPVRQDEFVRAVATLESIRRSL